MTVINSTKFQTRQSIFSKAKNSQALISALANIPEKWALTPIGTEKRPYRLNWQNEAPVNREDIAKDINGLECYSKEKDTYYKKYAHGFGVRTGEVSDGLLAIDFDGLTAHPLWKAIKGDGEDPVTVSWTSGKEGREQRGYQIPDKFRQQFKDLTRIVVTEHQEVKTKHGDDGRPIELLEVRYNGCQSVLPPSHHPTTGHYKWVNSPDKTEIAFAPDWLCEFVLGIAEREKAEAEEKARQAQLERDRRAKERALHQLSGGAKLEDILQQSIDRLGIDAFDWSGHHFKEMRGHLEGSCPHHQSQSGRSFHVDLSTLKWWCFGCGVGGHVVDYKYFVKTGKVNPRGKDFIEILKELAKDANVEFPEKAINKKALQYIPKEATDEYDQWLQEQQELRLSAINSELDYDELESFILDQISLINKNYPTPYWSEEKLADFLADDYKDDLIFESESKEWFSYSQKSIGVWAELKDCFLKQKLRFKLKEIKDQIKAKNNALKELKQIILEQENLEGEEQDRLSGFFKFGNFKEITSAFVERLAKHLSWLLAVEEMQSNHKDNLIPFKNGVLDVEKKELLPYQPDYLFTWQLPYDYNPLAQCDPIKKFLLETLGDESLVELIRAYFYGILAGRTDWQKYLELIGTGGAGKGTIQRLAIALVGFNNCHVTTLRDLETNRFEPANLRNKRLAIISEADDYVGSFNILKALLGQDPLRREVKQRQASTFIPECLVLIASNENIRTKDNTSGMARRRITIGFNKAVAPHKRRDLISFDRHNNPQGDFAPYIPGLLNWVLTINPSDAEALVKDSDRRCPGLMRQKIETAIATNSIASWLQDNIALDPYATTFIGRALRSKDELEVFLEADCKLYPNYCRYVESHGLKAVSLNRFRENLMDYCNAQLKLEGIADDKHRTYGRFIKGLRLRVDSDTQAPILDQVYLGFNTREDREDLRRPEITSETAETQVETAGMAIGGVSKHFEENNFEDSNDTEAPPPREKDPEVNNTENPSQPSQPSLTGFQPSQEVVTGRHGSSQPSQPTQEETGKNQERDYDTVVKAFRECPDAETLAMYTDVWTKEDREVAWGMLTQAERDRLKPMFEEIRSA